MHKIRWSRLAQLRKQWFLLLGFCGWMSLPGCGYTAGELYPEQYTTVAVPIPQNKTFYRGVEFDLGEAITKQMELRTPYKVVASASADTELVATVATVRQRQVNRTRTGGLPQEIEVRVSIDFAWRDLHTDQTIRDRKGFVAVGHYIPAAPVGETIEVGLQRATDRLAEDVVSTLRADW